MTRSRLVSVPDMRPDDWVEVCAGSTLAIVTPNTTGPIVLRFNGAFLLRADWPEVLGADDDVEWLVDQPGDKEDFRTLLAIAAVIAAIVPGLQGFAPYLAAASIAYNLLVPPTVLRQPDNDAKSIYSASLAGNQARLDQPIWRLCGIDKINPPFAAQPYYEFDSNGDQFYYAVFAVGYGPHDILGEFIGKTPIRSFADVVTRQYLPPGTQPTTALANVFSSSEVTGLELDVGRYVGGFIACQPGRLVKSIGWDVIAAQGLGKPRTDDSDDTTVTVEWQVEYCEVNDAGAEISEWRVLLRETKTGSTNTPQRWSNKQDLPTPCRPKVRMARANPKNTDSNARDGIEWAGMRAYLLDAAPLNPNVSHYEVVMRASQQLSAQSQTDFNMIVQGKCRPFDETGFGCEIGDWANYVATRNPASWLADLWSDPNWGEGLGNERIDLQTLTDLYAVWVSRQDRFDYTFTTRTDAWSASQLIASAGRARVFRRYGVRTLARDALATMGESALTARNCIGDMTMTETFPSATDPDGVIVEYTSNRLWDIDTIECPCPGVSATDETSPEYDPTLPMMSRPVYQKYEGIKGRTHAKREGLYHAADLALRRRTVTAKTEMQRITQAFLLPTRWQPLIPGYGQTGDVAAWDETSLVMTLTEPPDFSRGPTYLTLRRDDGSLTAPVLVSPGAGSNDIVLPAAPDFDIVVDAAHRERPIFILGTLDAGGEIVKPSSIKPSGSTDRGCAYFDNPRVHRRDNPYLPGPGDDQDPIGLPGDSGGGGTLILLTLTDHYIADGQAIGGGALYAGIEFHNDGTLWERADRNNGGDGLRQLSNEWLLVPVEVAQAGAFEIRASVPAFFAGIYDLPTVIVGDPLDTWLSLDTNRSWKEVLIDNTQVPLRIEIRKIGEEVLQASRTIYLTSWMSGITGGPGGGGG